MPTVQGREESLERACTSFAGAKELLLYADRPACGQAWVEGANAATGNHIFFASDDIEAQPGFCDAMVAAIERGSLPAALVLEANGTLQSCGGVGSTGLCHAGCPDWQPVEWSPTPFIAKQWWTDWLAPHADMLAQLHYSSDVLVSLLLARHGIGTVVRTEAKMTHYNHPVGRGDQHGRTAHDQGACHAYLAALA